MKVLISNILYNEKTREWNININSIAGYKEYIDNPQADHDVWTFGKMMEMGANNIPSEFIIEVPYTNLVDDIENIDEYVKAKIKEKTTRDVLSLTISEVE